MTRCSGLVLLCAWLVGCGVTSPLSPTPAGGEATTADGAKGGANDAATPDADAGNAPTRVEDASTSTADSPDASATVERPPCGGGAGCDPHDFGGESCESLGLGEGELLCDPTSCTIIVALCKGLGTETPRLGPPCGTGPGCDPADLGDETCATLGMGAGVLACDPVTCMFDTSMCSGGGGGGGTGGGTGG